MLGGKSGDQHSLGSRRRALVKELVCSCGVSGVTVSLLVRSNLTCTDAHSLPFPPNQTQVVIRGPHAPLDDDGQRHDAVLVEASFTGVHARSLEERIRRSRALKRVRRLELAHGHHDREDVARRMAEFFSKSRDKPYESTGRNLLRSAIHGPLERKLMKTLLAKAQKEEELGAAETAEKTKQRLRREIESLARRIEDMEARLKGKKETAESAARRRGRRREEVEDFPSYRDDQRKVINLRSLYFNKGREDAFFCSSLVAACYQAAGLLPREIPENEYSPALFSGEGENDELLPLRHCRLGSLEVVIGAENT